MRIPRTTPLLAVLVLASCSNADRFSVDGVDAEFCVPKTGYIAPNIWFVPEDAPGTPRGFSFSGCHRLAPRDRAECQFPPEFIGADVEPLSVKRNVAWSELKDAAIFASLAAEPTTQYVVDPSTRMLVVSNKTVWDRWSVWKRATPNDPGKELNDRDRLVVSCTEIGNFEQSAGLGKVGEYGCSRYTRGNAYAMEYQFITKGPVPSEQQLRELESKIFAQVNSWRCPK
jgi:hypothetical protein